MTARSRVMRAAGLILFVIGIALGLALAIGPTWADLESMFYGFEKMGDLRLKSYSCPLLITPAGPENVSARFTNTTDKPVRLTTRVDVSSPIIRTEQSQTELPPHQTKKLDWPVSWDDRDLTYFVLVSMSSYPTVLSPFRQSTCGILAVNVPGLTGAQLTYLWLVASLACVLAGMVLWEAGSRKTVADSRQGMYAMLFVAVTVLAALFFTFLGWWALAGLLIVLAIMAIGASLYVVAS